MTLVLRLVPLLGTLILAACTTLPPSQRAVEPTLPVTAPASERVSPTQSIAPAPLPAVQPVAEVVAPRDLWERMQRGFAMPDLDHELVGHWERWYAGRPDYLQRMADRANKYLFHVVEEIERRNLPLELALLPFIESAFNPQAVSRAKAAGMWQFMPATGKHFDLKQNAFRDDRRDVLASTRAALDYLERLHRMFGDWHLALAAYNWGEGNVQRAIRRNQAAGLSTGYADLRVPDETRNYVPKLQAVKNLVAAPDHHGVRLPAIGNHPFFDTVRIDRDIDVALIAKLADVTEADFRTLNPAHNKPVIMAAGTPEILLPWDNALQFSQRLQAYNGPTASWTAWRVPRNMTVAEAARQLGWNARELRKLNRVPARMRLKAGATILVPREGKLDRDVPEHLADNAQLLLAPEGAATRTVRVKVRSGDTLSGLARRYRVSVSDLASWNRLSPSAKLRVGQVLTVKAPAARAAKAPAKTGKTRATRKAAKVDVAQGSKR